MKPSNYIKFIVLQVSELIIQLREYESGTYGLEDAKNKIKNLEKQKQIRDTQIEQLIQSLNELQDEENLLEHENHVLRWVFPTFIVAIFFI